MTGLYIHLPFCAKKCHYCNFIITTRDDAASHGLFLSALEKEVRHWQPRLSARSFDTLYLGGGTPSRLSRDEFEKLFKLVQSAFHLNPTCEITCEVNPHDITKEKAECLYSLGIRRISLGAQSFHDKTLRALNRDHEASDIQTAFFHLRNAGFKNISLDLILSLPEETLEDVKQSLSQAMALKPQHLSLYELTVEAKTVFGNRLAQGTLTLPAEELQTDMLLFAREFLKSQGFLHYELLSYAKAGFESRHNLLYWDNQEYLGLGPGAFSYLEGRRFKNSESVEDYLLKIKNDDWGAVENETLSEEKKEVESLLLALRLSRGADKHRFQKVMQRLDGPIQDLTGKGLVEEAGQHLRLTAKGQLFAETVFTELSTPTPPNPLFKKRGGKFSSPPLYLKRGLGGVWEFSNMTHDVSDGIISHA